MKTLHDLGVCYDEQGCLRNERTGEYITLSNIHGDAQSLVNAITQHVHIFRMINRIGTT